MLRHCAHRPSLWQCDTDERAPVRIDLQPEAKEQAEGAPASPAPLRMRAPPGGVFPGASHRAVPRRAAPCCPAHLLRRFFTERTRTILEWMAAEMQ